ncbi:RNA polymerase sigma-70 factor [Chitinophaga polysaccharea]|uniref:RNA polymerase sigma factor n=1 Tax=Chitinophaga TaxID=79328 RepID=UPI0014550986|nr:MULTISPECIES: RNA polymerase sigma-70 factor [Chitinophaga]NLR59141.1 RNA polymerase sigma-70 factor [Chitinophaga polysaccharea]NLU92088.1 RNA polymerase sigma-70 factor [Chitinophaga sp. Ak27]
MSRGVHLFSDEELLCLMADDDEAAFTALYHRYWETLLGMAYQRLKDLPAAEDIVHDVFAGIWRNRKTLAAQHLKAYLAAAVKYMTIAHFRKKEYGHQYGASLQQTSLPGNDMENSVHYRHILQMVNEEVNNLPEKCRVVFRYSRHDGMSSRQIAEQMGISTKTVDNQLHKAITHLRHKMKHILHTFFSTFF